MTCAEGALVRMLPWAAIAACLVTSARTAESTGLDSARTRFEVGFATDVTNEQYYEEDYTDTTFLGRRLRELPESRSAGVAAMEWVRRGASGRWGMEWRPEVSFGDRTQRAGAAGRIRWLHANGGSVSIEPRIEWRDDHSFDLERTEWRGDLRARFQRPLGSTDRLELNGGAGWLAASGEDVSLLLDRRTARAGVRWSRLPVFGWEWGLRANTEGRQFPDSTERDHLESGFGAEARRLFGEGSTFSASIELTQRAALSATASTRDRFWAPRISIGLDLRPASAARLVWSAEAEAMRYRSPDALAYFDYETARTQLDLERDLGGGWSARIGPRLEWLLSASNASERYAQTGVGIQCDRFGTGAWWSLGPEAGWRQFERETDTIIAAPGIHSSFAYYGFQVLAEATLAGRWRTRLTADARIEKHRDASQDARSLYFSLDVRRLLAPG